METTKNKILHTPGQWEVRDNNIYPKSETPNISLSNIAIVVRRNFELGTDGKHKKDFEMEANAKRIVKCVNMHDELTDALHLVFKQAKGLPLKTINKIVELLKQSEQA